MPSDPRPEILENLGSPFPPEMADHPAAAAVNVIFTQAARFYLDPIAAGLTPISLIQGVHNSLQHLDHLLDGIPETVNFEGMGKMSIACTKGCFYCCTLRVTTTAPVVLALAEFLRQTLTEEQMNALNERIEDFDKETERLTPLQQVVQPRLCPLNVQGLCIGYEYRPTSCRTHHSFDVDRCKEAIEPGATVTTIPQDPHRFAMQDLVVGATDRCNELLGLRLDELELIPALKLALDNPNASAEYSAGAKPFAPAHRPEVIAAQQANFPE